MKLFYLDQKQLQFKQFDNELKVILIMLFLSIIILSYNIGKFTSDNTITDTASYKTELTIGTQEWKDSVFSDYEYRASIYLQKFNTPIEPGMLKLAAYNTYDSTGILVPLELALAQAQLESSMGTKGRSPVNNPFNVGEYDNGTVIWFSSTFEGVQAYYYLIAKNYLRCKSINTLFKSFTNCNGYRYASAPNYEIAISNQVNYISEYINNHINVITDEI